jgi:hypothetical protein
MVQLGLETVVVVVLMFLVLIGLGITGSVMIGRRDGRIRELESIVRLYTGPGSSDRVGYSHILHIGFSSDQTGGGR